LSGILLHSATGKTSCPCKMQFRHGFEGTEVNRFYSVLIGPMSDGFNEFCGPLDEIWLIYCDSKFRRHMLFTIQSLSFQQTL
jgi:hypothetical protein